MEHSELKHRFLSTTFKLSKIKVHTLFHELSKSEYCTLEMIYQGTKDSDNEKIIGVSDLAKNMRVSSPAVSRMLRVLESKGLIERTVCRENRRNTNVSITQAGLNERNQILLELDEFIKIVFAQMGVEDMEHFLTLMNKFIDSTEYALIDRKKGNEDGSFI